jgi:hypothetical protein
VRALNSPQYRERLKERAAFQLAHAVRLRAAGASGQGRRYGEAAEAAAWRCAFGPPPMENSCSLDAVAALPGEKPVYQDHDRDGLARPA